MQRFRHQHPQTAAGERPQKDDGQEEGVSPRGATALSEGAPLKTPRRPQEEAHHRHGSGLDLHAVQLVALGPHGLQQPQMVLGDEVPVADDFLPPLHLDDGVLDGRGRRRAARLGFRGVDGEVWTDEPLGQAKHRPPDGRRTVGQQVSRQ